MDNQPVKGNVISEKEFKKSFGENLKRLRENLNLSRNASATQLGVANSTLQAWEESGERTPNAWDVFRIVEAYGISLEELYNAYFPMQINSENSLCEVYDNAGNAVNLNDFSFIPRYDVSASAGHGCNICQENFMFSMAYRNYWIKNYLKVNPKDLIAITARGDSMMGVIDDRDVMIVDTANTSLTDGIYVLRLDDSLLVKRTQILPNQIIRISSANPVYEPFEIDMKKPPNDFDVIGCVVHTEPGTLFRYRKYSNPV